MDPQVSPRTSMAPREIADLVYRCCRVAGVEAGVAHRCGENVMHSEIHRGGGAMVFLETVAQGHDAVHRFARAADAVEHAEALHTSADFAVAVPVAALSASLWAAASRGYVEATVGDLSDASAAVSVVKFEADSISATRVSEAQARTQRAMTNGLYVDHDTARQLTQASEAFLVAEHVVDEALEPE